MPRKHPDRAPYGSLAGEPRQILSVPADIRAEVKRLAEQEGVTVTEWWRRAARERIERQVHR